MTNSRLYYGNFLVFFFKSERFLVCVKKEKKKSEETYIHTHKDQGQSFCMT